MRERFLAKRIQNLIGDSELDDGLTRELAQELEMHLEKILTNTELRDIYYSQGYVAALRSTIEKVRLFNKRKLIQQEEED